MLLNRCTACAAVQFHRTNSAARTGCLVEMFCGRKSNSTSVMDIRRIWSARSWKVIYYIQKPADFSQRIYLSYMPLLLHTSLYMRCALTKIYNKKKRRFFTLSNDHMCGGFPSRTYFPHRPYPFINASMRLIYVNDNYIWHN